MYTLKDWCDINNQQQQQQFHHQALHQKGGWNNFGPIADWTSIDPAIVSSSRPLPFQTTSTWQFPHVHPTHTVSHNAQQVLNTFMIFLNPFYNPVYFLYNCILAIFFSFYFTVVMFLDL